jgi:hypothetical protein
MLLISLKPQSLLVYSIILCYITTSTVVQAQEAFDPPEIPLQIKAVRSSSTIRVDGMLDEAAWQLAPVVGEFVQQNPVQGAKPSAETLVRFLYDADFLYVSAVCKDSLKKYGVRLQNMQRDFSLQENDYFGFNLDAYMDKRNSLGFFVTPAGAQSDRMYASEYEENTDWDALWYAKTSISDTAWTVEIAIPWKTLRYGDSCTQMGITLTRAIRRNFEFNAFPAIPRAYSPARMVYEAALTGIEPPPPTASIQVNPYVLGEVQRRVQGNETTTSFVPKLGGEVKWAVTPNSVLDLTVNTDFAQADVDRQVVNLSRFSVFFPERRQFFLENAGLFFSGFDRIQPFFSRSIGLDNTGNPVPIDAGARFISQTPSESVGLIAMRQRGHDSSPASWFGVARYQKNLGEQSRVGVMATVRNDESITLPDGSKQASMLSGTVTMNGTFRPSQIWAMDGMVSVSFDPETGRDVAAGFWTGLTDTWGYAGIVAQYVGKQYQSRTGFLALEDFINLNPGFELDLRPTWLPSFIRSYSPDGDFDAYWTSGGKFIQADMQASILNFSFQDGGFVEYRPQQVWQDMDGSFAPLDVRVQNGNYTYTRHRFRYSSDQSAVVSANVSYQLGGFFDGTLNFTSAELRFAPLPNIQLSTSYEWNQIRNLGKQHSSAGILDSGKSFDTHLLGVNARLALNPQTQLIGFVQWNSAAQRTVWNVRLAWEYLPLSFVYLVFNSNDQNFLVNGAIDRRITQQGIAKITFIRQL